VVFCLLCTFCGLCAFHSEFSNASNRFREGCAVERTGAQLGDLTDRCGDRIRMASGARVGVVNRTEAFVHGFVFLENRAGRVERGPEDLVCGHT
jgi:hypothetical protein